MPARIVRPLILMGLIFLIIKFCGNKSKVSDPPGNAQDSPVPENPKQPNILRPIQFIILCDRHVLQNPAQILSLQTQIEQQCLSSQTRQWQSLNIELYALDCATAGIQQLLPNCYIKPTEASMVNRGSFQTEGIVRNRWQVDFKNLKLAGQDRCNQIIASLHVLNMRLGSASINDDIRILYVSDWTEMDAENDFARQTYRLRSNNPRDGGIYDFDGSVLKEMCKRLKDSTSEMRVLATHLKSTIDQGKWNVPKVYYLNNVPGKFADDRNTNEVSLLNDFWNDLFGYAGIQRQNVNNLQAVFQ